MSILIKGAKMPTACCGCPCILEEWLCGAKGVYVNSELINPYKERPSWCPLVEIPPHGRLIDADKLEYSSISCWAPDEVRPPRDDTEWLISKYEIDEEAPTIIESEEQEHD